MQRGEYLKKVLPIGISSYETLKNKDYYVVDKTKLIEEFLNQGYLQTLVKMETNFFESRSTATLWGGIC